MATQELTDSNFKELIDAQGSKLVIVDFWAEWCAPCKMLAPILEKISETYEKELTVFKIDTDSNTKTAQYFQIASIPCCILFKNQEEVHRIIGHKSEDSFIEELKPFL